MSKNCDSPDEFLLDVYACDGSADDLNAMLTSGTRWSPDRLWSALEMALFHAHAENTRILIDAGAPTHLLTPERVNKYKEMWRRCSVLPKMVGQTLKVLQSKRINVGV